MENEKELLRLGVAMGQQNAFGAVAGRCPAAQAETLRRVREEKLYLCCATSWREFCPEHLGMSSSQADRTIALLEEFGPRYFTLSQLTRISAEAYRAIEPAVQEGKIECRGEVIELAPENARKVAAAVAVLRKEAAQKTPAAAAPDLTDLTRRFNALLADVRRASEAGGRSVGETLQLMMCRLQKTLQEARENSR
jgi:hypothetical protein